MATLFPFLLILLALGVIVFIVVKKYPQLTLLDVETIAETKEDKKKDEIIKKRAKTKIAKSKTDWKVKLTPVVQKAKDSQLKFRKYVGQIQNMVEEEIKKREAGALPVQPPNPEEHKNKVESFLKNARHALDNHKYDEAEKMFIQVIRLDQKNKEAYRGLGDVYFEQEQYPEAEETYKFLTRLSRKDAGVYVRLADVAEAKRDFAVAADYIGKANAIDETRPERFMRGADLLQKAHNNEGALEAIHRAVELEPENPKYLDRLIEFAILVGDKKLAGDTLNQLKKVNPDNNKLGEIAEKITRMQ